MGHIRSQATVDSALWLSDIGLRDADNAEIHGVALKTIRRWRRGVYLLTIVNDRRYTILRHTRASG